MPKPDPTKPLTLAQARRALRPLGATITVGEPDDEDLAGMWVIHPIDRPDPRIVMGIFAPEQVTLELIASFAE